MAATVNQSLLEVLGSLLYGVVAKLQQRAALVWHNTRQTLIKHSANTNQTIGTNATPPASEDGVFNCSEQLRLTMDSGVPSRMVRSSTVHCQSQLQGIVEKRSSLAGGVAFDILPCKKDDHQHLHLQGK